MHSRRDENQKLKRLVADLSLDKAMPKDFRQKSVAAWPAAGGRSLGSEPYRVSERRGCDVLRFDRMTHRCKSIRADQAP